MPQLTYIYIEIVLLKETSITQDSILTLENEIAEEKIIRTVVISQFPKEITANDYSNLPF
jgi:hypothetical protein